MFALQNILRAKLTFSAHKAELNLGPKEKFLHDFELKTTTKKTTKEELKNLMSIASDLLYADTLDDVLFCIRELKKMNISVELKRKHLGRSYDCTLIFGLKKDQVIDFPHMPLLVDNTLDPATFVSASVLSAWDVLKPFITFREELNIDDFILKKKQILDCLSELNTLNIGTDPEIYIDRINELLTRPIESVTKDKVGNLNIKFRTFGQDLDDDTFIIDAEKCKTSPVLPDAIPLMGQQKGFKWNKENHGLHPDVIKKVKPYSLTKEQSFIVKKIRTKVGGLGTYSDKQIIETYSNLADNEQKVFRYNNEYGEDHIAILRICLETATQAAEIKQNSAPIDERTQQHQALSSARVNIPPSLPAKPERKESNQRLIKAFAVIQNKDLCEDDAQVLQNYGLLDEENIEFILNLERYENDTYTPESKGQIEYYREQARSLVARHGTNLEPTKNEIKREVRNHPDMQRKECWIIQAEEEILVRNMLWLYYKQGDHNRRKREITNIRERAKRLEQDATVFF